MNDRDTFAAAALIGFIAYGDYSPESMPKIAYRMADAMLRERGDTPASYKKNDEKRGCTPTKREGDIVTRLRQTRANMIGTDDEDHYFDCHDAAGEIDRLRSRVWETPRTQPPHATHPQGSVHGECSVPDSRTENEPVAWAVMARDGFGIEGTFTDRDEACEWCHGRQQVVPLYRHPQPTLTDEEREAVMRATDGYIAWKDDNGELETPDVQATLATMRGLLDRLK